MLRNYLAATLRNLVRNRLYSLISVAGLGIGIWRCAAGAAGGAQPADTGPLHSGLRTLYLVVTVNRTQGGPVDYSRTTDGRIAALLEQRSAGRAAGGPPGGWRMAACRTATMPPAN